MSDKRLKKVCKKKLYVNHIRDNIKHTNICIIGIPEGEEKEKGQKTFEEIKIENFPNLKTKVGIT